MAPGLSRSLSRAVKLPPRFGCLESSMGEAIEKGGFCFVGCFVCFVLFFGGEGLGGGVEVELPSHDCFYCVP